MDIFLSWLSSFRYIVLFVGVLFEGPVVMVMAGFLVKTGFFALVPTYFLLVAGDLVGDVVWYAVGYFGADTFVRKYGKFFSLTPDGIEGAKAAYRRHDTSILFISKITMGLGLAVPVLVSAGLSRVSFRKYLALNTLGEFVWTAFLMTAGYFFATAYAIVAEGLHIGAIILLLVIMLGVAFGFGKYMRTFLLKGKI